MSKKALSLFQDDGTPEKLGGSPGVKSRDKKLRKSRNAEYYNKGFARIFHNYWKRTPLITPMPPTICLPRPQLQESPKGIYALFVATYPIHIAHPVE